MDCPYICGPVDSEFSFLQVSDHLLECMKCGNIVHPACLAPPLAEKVDCDWYCYQCGENTSDYQLEQRRYQAEVLHRYALQKAPLSCFLETFH